MSRAAVDSGAIECLSGVTGPVLVIGAGGMLGRAFQALFQGRIEFAAMGRDKLDITDRTSLRRIAVGPWRTCINCAAYTDVDGAEDKEFTAMAGNASGVSLLAQTCRDVGATLVHFSSDYVFNGEASTPYATHEPRSPVGAYGRTKAMGEEAIEMEVSRGLGALTIRTSWLYAPWGKNFVRTIARLACERPSLKVVNDQRGRPTSAEHLAMATVQMLAKTARGIHHIADAGECTWFELAREVAAYVNPSCVVLPCTTSEFVRPAPRPAYSVLDLSLTEQIIGPRPHWKQTLADVLPRLEP
jgi:dTDP-4-dehydrorhamnose reductase